MILWIFLLGLAYGTFGAHIHYQDCGAIGSYMIEDVYLDVPCPKQPCWLPLKRQTNLTIAFKTSNIRSLYIVVKAYMKDGDSERNIETVQTKCPASVCPIGPNEKKAYSTVLKPQFTYPTTAVKVFLELLNQKQDVVVCAFFHAKIYDPDLTKPSDFENKIDS